MADNERKIVTTFEANIDQFNAATQKLNKDIKGINLQFNNATASLDKYSDSQEWLKAKTEQLNKTLKAQQNALNESKEKFNDLVASGKANSKEAEQLAAKILRQETAIKKTQKALDGYNEELEELEEAGVDSRKALDKLNKEAEESKQAFEDANNSLKTGFLVGIGGIAAACVGAVKGLSSIIENTQELRLEQGRVQVAFEKAGHSADTAKKIYGDFNAVLGDTAKTIESMQHMAQLADTEEELNILVKAGTGIFATYGNSLPIESLMEAANETARTGELTGALTDSIVWAGKSEEDFQKKLDKCNGQQERQALIISTLNELYGEAGKAYQETNKDVIAATKAQDEYNNKMAEIAKKVQPAMTEFKLTFVEALTKVMEKFNEADIENLIGGIANTINALVTQVMPPLLNVLSWVLDNMNWLAPAIMSVVSGILAATLAYKTITTVMNLVKIAQLGLNAAMLANPIGLVSAAIGVLVGAFVVLWNKCEGFRNFWKQLWSDIKKGVENAVEGIKIIFSGIVNTLKNVVNGIISLINGAINGINKISVKIPDWVPKFGGNTLGFNIPTIPQLAQGGIVDQPTLAMVGEAGKEAIMPLENNTEWINKLAEKLGGKLQGNVTYNINNKFEKMESSKLALHKANLEMKRIIGGH
jgi:phage-related minor tail protein